MDLKNQEMALSDIRFDEMPQELAKQFSGIGDSNSLTKKPSESTPLQREVTPGFKADDIISGLGVSKFHSTTDELSSQENASKIRPPKSSFGRSSNLGRPPESPMKVVRKKIRIKGKKTTTFSRTSIEFSESESQIHN